MLEIIDAPDLIAFDAMMLEHVAITNNLKNFKNETHDKYFRLNIIFIAFSFLTYLNGNKKIYVVYSKLSYMVILLIIVCIHTPQ